MSPPQHNVALGLWGSNHYGEARLDSACDEGTNNVYDNVPHPELSKEGWSFMSISRSNTTGRIEVGVNLVKTFEGGQFNNGGLCLFDPAALFTAIEISYPMLFELTNTVGIPPPLLRFRSFDRTRPGLILGPKGRTTFKWSGCLCASIRVVYAQGP